MTPKQWMIYSVDLEPRVGTKPGKQRPCLVVQPTPFAEAGLTSSVVLPITTQLKESAFPLRIRIPAGMAGLIDASDIMIDQILAWDNQLFKQEIGSLPLPLIQEVQLALQNFLDL